MTKQFTSHERWKTFEFVVIQAVEKETNAAGLTCCIQVGILHYGAEDLQRKDAACTWLINEGVRRAFQPASHWAHAIRSRQRCCQKIYLNADGHENQQISDLIAPSKVIGDC